MTKLLMNQYFLMAVLLFGAVVHVQSTKKNALDFFKKLEKQNKEKSTSQYSNSRVKKQTTKQPTKKRKVDTTTCTSKTKPGKTEPVKMNEKKHASSKPDIKTEKKNDVFQTKNEKISRSSNES